MYTYSSCMEYILEWLESTWYPPTSQQMFRRAMVRMKNQGAKMNKKLMQAEKEDEAGVKRLRQAALTVRGRVEVYVWV